MSRFATRREFVNWLSASAALTACGFGSGCRVGASESPLATAPQAAQILPPLPPASDAENGSSRASGSMYLGDYRASALEKVRCAFIGVGARGSGHVEQLAMIQGVEIVAICDLYPDLAQASREVAMRHGHQNIEVYSGDPQAYRTMLAQQRPDAVFIATPWQLHAQHAIASMQAGAHAFVEVPLAPTLAELWQVVDVAEATGKHCMMMENVCYGREELLFLNIVRHGVLGELLHGEAAYIHELRKQMHEEERGTGSWRTYHYAARNGNLYPTHGLGPVAQYMSLGRGPDTFSHLVSMSSPVRGRKAYAAKNFPPNHKWNQLAYEGGDLNTSVLQTKLGKTIMVQWDETSPRPYSRHNLIQGTKGALAGFPSRWAIEGMGEHHRWNEDLSALYETYEHPLYRRVGALAEKMGGHGGMDFIMLYRIIECLRGGAPLDQNLYEGALWSAVAPLTEASVAEGATPQAFPDFTRSDFAKTQPLSIVS